MARWVVMQVSLILAETVEVVSESLCANFCCQAASSTFCSGPVPRNVEELVAMTSLVLEK